MARSAVFVSMLVYILSRQALAQRWNVSSSRKDFPRDFTFGVGSSAFQYEGAVAEDGRKPSIVDTYIHKPGVVLDGSTADITVDQYHRYKEDVELMHQLGIDAYRLSISWSRLLPDGKGTINPKGLEYYNNLINELVYHGIEPYVTLYHFDLPQSLQDEYGGWLSRQIVDDFTVFANVCFVEFGDRVKNWMTFNEPNFFSMSGYGSDIFAPQRCSPAFGNCSAGNSSVEPYIVGHNVLLSHAAVVELYRQRYQAQQGGSIGLTIVSLWFDPLTDEFNDLVAAQRMRDFQIGWFIDPLIFGDYPASMKERVGCRLPSFTKKQSEKLKGSFDLIGVNHYSTYYVADLPMSEDEPKIESYWTDPSVSVGVERNGILISNETSFYGMPVVPWGIQRLLEYMKTHYHNPPVSILENGFARPKDSSSLEEPLDDWFRVDFLTEYLKYVSAAIRNGSDTRGYFIWTLLDDFELLTGYSWDTGLFYVDFNDNLKRYPKKSAFWYKEFLQRNTELELLETPADHRNDSVQ